MTKFKLSILTVLTLTIFSSVFISCANDENGIDVQKMETTNVLKTSSLIYYNNLTNKLSTKKNNAKSASTTEHSIELAFNSNTPIPEFETNEELKNYLEVNQQNINGKIIFKIDSNIVYESDVVNGQKINSNENEKDSFLMKAYPCSFDGLAHCTQDRIDDMNWFDTTLCIIAGPECVGENFISCAVDNC